MIGIHDLGGFDNLGRVHQEEGATFHEDWEKLALYLVLPQATGCQRHTSGAEVNRNVSSMSGGLAVPRNNGELVFDAPWESRAFGLAVGLSQAGLLAWDTFRAALAKAITDNGAIGCR